MNPNERGTMKEGSTLTHWASWVAFFIDFDLYFRPTRISSHTLSCIYEYEEEGISDGGGRERVNEESEKCIQLSLPLSITPSDTSFILPLRLVSPFSFPLPLSFRLSGSLLTSESAHCRTSTGLGWASPSLIP